MIIIIVPLVDDQRSCNYPMFYRHTNVNLHLVVQRAVVAFVDPTRFQKTFSRTKLYR